jgi:hypothetical protein
VTDPTNPLADRAVLEHAKTIIETPSSELGHLTPLEQQQYKFFTTANLLLHKLVVTLLAELPKGGK